MSKAIVQEDGTFQNDTGAVVDAENRLIDDDGALINDDGFLINETGQLLNATGEAVDTDGNLIDADNKIINDDDDGKGHMVPKSRYDTAARRATEAEDELAKAQATIAAGSGSDASGGGPKSEADFVAEIDALDAKIEGARKDGDVDTIVRLNKEQRDLERTMYANMAESKANTAGTKAQQKVALDNMIVDLEANNEFFNPNSDKFDQALVDEVLDLQHAFVAKGNTPASAMAKAVGYVIPASKEAGGAGGRTTDNNKNLAAANSQAPKMGETGKGSAAGGDTGEASNIGDMTTEEFDALPKATKQRLRGDSYAS